MSVVRTLPHEKKIMREITGAAFLEIVAEGSHAHMILRAIRAERKRCVSIVLDRYDGAPDAGKVSMSDLAEIAREIEGER